MSIKSISVMLTGGIAGEGVTKGVCYVQFWCYFVIIYSEMVYCCWRFLPDILETRLHTFFSEVLELILEKRMPQDRPIAFLNRMT